MPVSKFTTIEERALERKGGEIALESMLSQSLDSGRLKTIPVHRYLSTMTKCINQAGFSWKVIEKKWPEFEEAFFGFELNKLALLSDEQWEAYTDDKRVVRSWQKIKALKDNVAWAYEEQSAREGIPTLIADWPTTDLVGLFSYLKKEGSRLGGNTGQRFLRYMGKDTFILTRDVCATLIASGLDIKPEPSSKRELTLIQNTFNDWQQESGRSYTELSQIAAYSVGDNYVLEAYE